MVLDFMILVLVSRSMALECLSLADQPTAHSNSMATPDDQSPENGADMHFQHRYFVSNTSIICGWGISNSIA